MSVGMPFSPLSYLLQLFNSHICSDILFIHLAESVTYSLNDFMSQQDEAMSRARQELKRLREKIVTVIVSVCQVHVYKFM